MNAEEVGTGEGPRDQLQDVRERLQDLDSVPVEDRPELFARVNEVLADNLSAMQRELSPPEDR